MRPRPFLPGQLTIVAGTRRDYFDLHRFHYCPKPPATWAAIWAVRYHEPDTPPRTVGVAVLSWPTPCNAGRQAWFNTRDSPFGQRLSWINQHLRTISRVILHPQFRGIGLATDLVRYTLAHAPTRFTEATARLAMVHPFFERAGMTRVSISSSENLYFIHDQLKRGNHDRFIEQHD